MIYESTTNNRHASFAFTKFFIIFAKYLKCFQIYDLGINFIIMAYVRPSRISMTELYAEIING